MRAHRIVERVQEEQPAARASGAPVLVVSPTDFHALHLTGLLHSLITRAAHLDRRRCRRRHQRHHGPPLALPCASARWAKPAHTAKGDRGCGSDAGAVQLEAELRRLVMDGRVNNVSHDEFHHIHCYLRSWHHPIYGRLNSVLASPNPQAVATGQWET
ncbi:hypothetical protein ZWY2020_021578 [Hordeum vulgare]|nr:hypothetical protein ZWY2020_021578 [Hordeum vulgare]